MKLLRLFAVVAVAATLVALPSSAVASTRWPIVTAGFQFVPKTVVISAGDGLDLTNADFFPHDVTSDLLNADGTPAFQSATIRFGQTAAVTGVENLSAGSYGFFCSIHPWMRGTLTVEAAS